jgi:hypothetical protein
MRHVSKEEFFAAIGPLDVNPRVEMSTLKDRLHVSQWEMQNTRQHIGTSVSDSWGVNATQFYLREG